MFGTVRYTQTGAKCLSHIRSMRVCECARVRQVYTFVSACVCVLCIEKKEEELYEMDLDNNDVGTHSDDDGDDENDDILEYPQIPSNTYTYRDRATQIHGDAVCSLVYEPLLHFNGKNMILHACIY